MMNTFCGLRLKNRAARVPRLIVWMGAGAVWFVLGGCQQYQAKPLDMEDYGQRWAERSASGDEVAAFLEQLESRAPLDQSFDVGDGLSLAEAEVVALVFNGRLRKARAAAHVASAEA